MLSSLLHSTSPKILHLQKLAQCLLWTWHYVGKTSLPCFCEAKLYAAVFQVPCINKNAIIQTQSKYMEKKETTRKACCCERISYIFLVFIVEQYWLSYFCLKRDTSFILIVVLEPSLWWTNHCIRILREKANKISMLCLRIILWKFDIQRKLVSLSQTARGQRNDLEQSEILN